MNKWDKLYEKIGDNIEPAFDKLEWTNKRLITRVPTNLALLMFFPFWCLAGAYVRSKCSR